MAKRISEDTKLIDTFVSINDATVKPSRNTGLRGYLKTIGATFMGTSVSAHVADERNSFLNLNDVISIEGGDVFNDLGNNIRNFHTLASDRFRQYAEYDDMSADTIISTALDLYADDSTQPDVDGKQIWMTSPDANSAQILTNLLQATKIKDDLWKIARLLAKYGDVYLELFYSDVEVSKAKLVESKHPRRNKSYIQSTHSITEALNVRAATSDGYVVNDYRIVPDIENLFDLRYNGKTVAYARLPVTNDSRYGLNNFNIPANDPDVIYYPKDKFVHFYIDEADNRNPDTFLVNVGDSGETLRFEVARGKSMIHDVFRALREMQLTEYSILMNRVARSSVFRFVKVEVGQMSKGNVDQTMRKVKNLVESKVVMNTNGGLLKPYADPGPVQNFLYVPVREGNGDISVDTISDGDVNIKDLADLEHQRDKVFAGLKIPKGMLNFDETTGALFNSGGTLTKQDERYARTIKRLQVFIRRGLTSFFDIILANRGESRIIDNYEVNLVPPATSEDEDRIAQVQGRITLAQNMMSVINDLVQTPGTTLDRQAYIDYIANDILHDSKIADMLLEAEPEQVDEDIDLGGERAEFEISDKTSSPAVSLGVGGGEESPTTTAEAESPTETSGEYGGEWSDI